MAISHQKRRLSTSQDAHLIELDLASKECIEKKIDTVAFDYAMVYCAGAIYSNMEEAERNRKGR